MNICKICICCQLLYVLCQICNHVLESCNACTTFGRVDLSLGVQSHWIASYIYIITVRNCCWPILLACTFSNVKKMLSSEHFKFAKRTFSHTEKKYVRTVAGIKAQSVTSWNRTPVPARVFIYSVAPRTAIIAWIPTVVIRSHHRFVIGKRCRVLVWVYMWWLFGPGLALSSVSDLGDCSFVLLRGGLMVAVNVTCTGQLKSLF